MRRPPNHPNPMVRVHGLAVDDVGEPTGRTCADCARLDPSPRGPVCPLRSTTPAGYNNPRHRAGWDACSLASGRAARPVDNQAA